MLSSGLGRVSQSGLEFPSGQECPVGIVMFQEGPRPDGSTRILVRVGKSVLSLTVDCKGELGETTSY